MPVLEARDARFLDRLARVRSLIKDNWSLCEFMGNCEKEVLVAQTIHATAMNLKNYGEPFSIRDPGVFSVQGGGLADNGKAYRFLINEGYFAEEKREGSVVIFPTEKLLAELEVFLKIRTKPEPMP